MAVGLQDREDARVPAAGRWRGVAEQQGESSVQRLVTCYVCSPGPWQV